MGEPAWLSGTAGGSIRRGLRVRNDDRPDARMVCRGDFLIRLTYAVALSTVSTFRWTGWQKRSPSTRNWLSSSSVRFSYRSAR